jgi:hypothetical protein
MAVLEALSEEECYLWAVISDESGLDLAEFAWFDHTRKEDGCWRAWDFQIPWFRCKDKRQIDQCARAVGKSQSIAVRAFAFAFIHPGEEMVITAPERVHLDAITDKVETQLMNTRLAREMLVGKGGRNSIKHQPFHVNFANGARIMGRIPQRDGRGVKGMHPIWLEMDEAQDYPKAGWDELIETLNTGFEGAVWRSHGVTRGVKDEFYKRSQPDSGWTVHHMTAMHKPKPHWDDEKRQEKIEEYGSKDAPNYRRNILGLHGDATNPLFVLHRLMQCVDQEDGSEYNLDTYQKIRITDESLKDTGLHIRDVLDYNHGHKVGYINYWCGMDIGFTNHPSEILVWGEKRGTKKDDRSSLELLTRVHLQRISEPDQVEAIAHTIEFYRPKTFALDSTGVGLPLLQHLQHEYPHLLPFIKGYNFSAKILVDFDATMPVDEWTGDPTKEAQIEKNVLEYAQDSLRVLVDTKRLKLPWDRELIGQFQGASASTRPGHDQYGRRKIFSEGDDHALDAARMAALGFTQWHIEQLMASENRDDVVDVFMEW